MIDLPEGWTHGPIEGWPGPLVISAPDGGMVTIDYERRKFRRGHNPARSAEEFPVAPPLIGRGWRARLETLAVEWLSAAQPPLRMPHAEAAS